MLKVQHVLDTTTSNIFRIPAGLKQTMYSLWLRRKYVLTKDVFPESLNWLKSLPFHKCHLGNKTEAHAADSEQYIKNLLIEARLILCCWLQPQKKITQYRHVYLSLCSEFEMYLRVTEGGKSFTELKRGYLYWSESLTEQLNMKNVLKVCLYVGECVFVCRCPCVGAAYIYLCSIESIYNIWRYYSIRMFKATTI